MNVYPAEVEAVLHAHPAVLDVAVIGLPSPEWGQSVHAAVVPRPGHAPSVAELEGHVARHLARFKHPRSWQLRERLPRTDAGKLLRRVLRDELSPGR